MKKITKLKGRLGLCQCKGCFRKSKYDVNINSRITLEVCSNHVKKIIEDLRGDK